MALIGSRELEKGKLRKKRNIKMVAVEENVGEEDMVVWFSD